jgi:uroporphyrin-III C-methyltransferase
MKLPVTEAIASTPAVAPQPPPQAASASAATAVPAVGSPAAGRWVAAGAVVLTAMSTAAMVYAWNTQQRVKALESELVKRQQDSTGQATEARVIAREAQDVAREAAAKMALLEARVAETTLQRSQLEELIQALARSRDENVLADLDAAIRVAMQQTAITGSGEPLVITLKQADERLARFNQPRLERVRRAVAQDLDKVRAAGVTDIAVLTIRLDEAIRQVDELPLLSAVDRRTGPRAPAPEPTASAPAAAASAAGWGDLLSDQWKKVFDPVWEEVRSLVRVTRIDQPESMLVAPEQAFFLRENLKLRLLNARLALLSRQFDTAQSDLRDAQSALDRYFDRSSKRVTATADLLKQVATQARLVTVPRPDATLAAIATASAGR